MVRIQQTQTEELRCGLWLCALEGHAFESRSLKNLGRILAYGEDRLALSRVPDGLRHESTPAKYRWPARRRVLLPRGTLPQDFSAPSRIHLHDGLQLQ